MGGSDSSSVEVGSESYALYGQDNGYWIKNLSDQPRLLEAMRVGKDITLKGRAAEGSAKNESYSLKGFAEALDRANRECR
jgi:hypothetical protein